MNGVIVLIGAVACGALLWGIARAGLGPGSDFVIRYRPGRRATVRGRLPASKFAGLSAFFARDLCPRGAVTVRGRWGTGRMLRVQISGQLNAFERQRVRNFLIDYLR
jgi:hypothetical protein